MISFKMRGRKAQNQKPKLTPDNLKALKEFAEWAAELKKPVVTEWDKLGTYRLEDLDFTNNEIAGYDDLTDEEWLELQEEAEENGRYLTQLEAESYFHHYSPVVFHTPGDDHESHWRVNPGLDKASQAMLMFIHE